MNSGRSTYSPTRPPALFAAYDLGTDQLYGHIKKTKNRSKFLEPLAARLPVLTHRAALPK